MNLQLLRLGLLLALASPALAMATKGTMHMEGWDWGPRGVDVALQQAPMA